MSLYVFASCPSLNDIVKPVYASFVFDGKVQHQSLKMSEQPQLDREMFRRPEDIDSASNKLLQDLHQVDRRIAVCFKSRISTRISIYT